MKGETKKALTSTYIEGIYILETDLVNGKAHWIQDSKENALWYDIWLGGWNIGWINKLGSIDADIHSPDNSVGPLEATNWTYYSNNDWIESTDISIQPGI